MKPPSWMKWTVLSLAAAAAVAVLAFGPRSQDLAHMGTWQALASPGELSAAHAFLSESCNSCHTAVKGVDASKCIACHANEEALLQRQPTSFHADVGDCVSCHVEHLGGGRLQTQMDHPWLARLSLSRLDESDPESAAALRLRMRDLRANGVMSHARGLASTEAALDCASCHSNQQPHNGFFGSDCAQCHRTDMWTVPQFRHPVPSSMDCASCHQAPPSHYMGHFAMVSQAVARQPNARVGQCYLCHQTTSWNDIRGVGWYKHH